MNFNQKFRPAKIGFLIRSKTDVQLYTKQADQQKFMIGSFAFELSLQQFRNCYFEKY